VPLDLALDLAEQTAATLTATHRVGVIHRDIKPSNLMFDDRGRLKVVDFGIARLTESTSAQLTATSTVVGSAAYMAPEQASGEPATPATDLYALGCSSWHCSPGSLRSPPSIPWRSSSSTWTRRHRGYADGVPRSPPPSTAWSTSSSPRHPGTGPATPSRPGPSSPRSAAPSRHRPPTCRGAGAHPRPQSLQHQGHPTVAAPHRHTRSDRDATVSPDMAALAPACNRRRGRPGAHADTPGHRRTRRLRTDRYPSPIATATASLTAKV
jgi:serine/threonine protein kinase